MYINNIIYNIYNIYTYINIYIYIYIYIVFSVDGGMVQEASKCYSRIAEKLAENEMNDSQ